MRRLILHIGAPKCGSTYVQNLMLRNGASLARAGFHYPPPTEGHPGNGLSLIDLTESQLSSWYNGPHHTVILSHEDLFAGAAHAKALAIYAKDQGIEVEIIAVLRPFADFIFGDLSQLMKQNFETYLSSGQPYDGLSFPQFVQRRTQTLRPAQFLRQWQRLFPQALTLIPLAQLRPQLQHCLGPNAIDNWTIPRDLTNPSLPMQACDTLAEMIRSGTAKPKVRAAFKAAFKPHTPPDLGRSTARINLINRAFSEQAKALKQDFDFDVPQ